MWLAPTNSATSHPLPSGRSWIPCAADRAARLEFLRIHRINESVGIPCHRAAPPPSSYLPASIARSEFFVIVLVGCRTASNSTMSCARSGCTNRRSLNHQRGGDSGGTERTSPLGICSRRRQRRVQGAPRRRDPAGHLCGRPVRRALHPRTGRSLGLIDLHGRLGRPTTALPTARRIERPRSTDRVDERTSGGAGWFGRSRSGRRSPPSVNFRVTPRNSYGNVEQAAAKRRRIGIDGAAP